MRPGSSAPSQVGSLTKFFFWLLWVAATASIVQYAISQLGWGIDLRDQTGDGRFLLLLIAAWTALVIIASERRSPHEFGIWISENWRLVYASTVAIGSLYCALSYIVALRAGLLTFVEAPTLSWITGGIKALGAFLSAPLQEIVFRGYLLTLARDRLGTWPAIIVTALAFALTGQVTLPVRVGTC